MTSISLLFSDPGALLRGRKNLLRLWSARFTISCCLLSVGAVAAFAAPEAVVRTESSLGIYRMGEPVRMIVAFPSASDGASRKVAWEVRDWKGRVKLEHTATIPADSVDGAIIRLSDLPNGWYEAKFQVDNQPLTAQSFVVVGDYKSRGETFRYGICAHFPRLSHSDHEKANELLERLGIDIFRFEVSWAEVQKKKDGPFTFERFDAISEDLKKLSIEPAILLDYGVPWASTAPAGVPYADTFRYPPQMEPWLAYVRAVQGRYGKTARYWEIWNEPDISFWKGSVEDYEVLFSRTATELARLDPKAEIMNGGFAMVSRQPNPDFMSRFVAGADRTHWSLFAWHDYMTLSETRQRIAQAEKLMSKNGFSLPLWMNEGGFHTLMPGGEVAQAVTLVKKITSVVAAGGKSYFWYSLWDEGALEDDTEGHFGLAKSNFQPKPAYAAYRELIARLADRPALKPVPAGSASDFCIIDFGARKSGTAPGGMSVIWRDTPGPDEPVWVAGESPTSRLRVFDLMGAPEKTEFTGGGIVLIGEDPRYIESLNGGSIQIRRILEIPSRSVIREGQAGKISIPVTNPLAITSEIRAELGWRGTNGSFVTFAQEWIGTLAPAATGIIEFQPDVAAFSRLAKQTPGSGELLIRFGTETVPQQISFPVEEPISIGAGSAMWRAALTEREFIRNLHEAEPDAELHWGGKQDLSAEVTAEWNAAGGLHLVVTARDDRHVQNFESAALWKGDSLQIAIATLAKPDDFLEATFGLTKSGKPDGWVNRGSQTLKIAAGPLPAGLSVDIRRKGDLTLYDVMISEALLSTASKEPFLLNFLVNDDDGRGRKQWLQFAPGLGDNKNPRLFRTFLHKQAN